MFTKQTSTNGTICQCKIGVASLCAQYNPI